MTFLANKVSVARRFQRSIRIDKDLGQIDAIRDFVCNASGQNALESVARATREGQRAFTWTGPYGGGKSSLALALAAFVNSDRATRRAAESVLSEVKGLREALPLGGNDWLCISLVGRRSAVQADLDDAIRVATGPRRGPRATDGRAVIDLLVREAAKRTGVLVIIDEMGKYLEAAAERGGDIHFFQELAEAANRSAGRLVVVGILHQAFDQYASRLSPGSRDEWTKVQGRYVDIPLVVAVDEVINLLGRAIVSRPPQSQTAIAKTVAAEIARRRPGSPADLDQQLARCWPLHPVTAAVLGPVSRRRFGQNERSTFAFLTSVEVEGFQHYLSTVSADDEGSYEPSRLWDYLKINLEPAILASPDSHRWALAVEAIERAEARGKASHVRVTKTVALIELFRNGSGLASSDDLIAASVPDLSRKTVLSVLADLKDWSILIPRRHLDAWGVFAGSDFDIDKAVEAARTNSTELRLDRLAAIAGIQPLLAKQHYHRTGALRWFDTVLLPLSNLEASVASLKPRSGASGTFVVVMPDGSVDGRAAQKVCKAASEVESALPVVIGLPRNAWILRELGSELLALEAVRSERPELEGDPVARREILARVSAVGSQLEEEFRASMGGATWYLKGESQISSGHRDLSRFVSEVADRTYPEAPTIHSELLNREHPSTNTQAAVRLLMYAMVAHSDKPALGILGFPAEKGLYSTVLSSLHAADSEGVFGFHSPRGDSTFTSMWSAADRLVASAKEGIATGSLYRLWAMPPFGIRSALLPILSLAYVLANHAHLAIYVEGTFRPELDTYAVDLWLQDADLVTIRRIRSAKQGEQDLGLYAEALKGFSPQLPKPQVLAVARAYVQFAVELPAWTRKTLSLSQNATAVRRILLAASDPHKTMFVDLPSQLAGGSIEKCIAPLKAALTELSNAYELMLRSLMSGLLMSLAHRETDVADLHQRARTVHGLSGDLVLDAFALRLQEYEGSLKSIEGLAAMSISKPTNQWTDRDPDRAALALADLAQRFRQAELYSYVKDRPARQHAIAVSVGSADNAQTVMERFDISDAERATAKAIAATMATHLTGATDDWRIMLAAVAQLGLTVNEQSSDAGRRKRRSA